MKIYLESLGCARNLVDSEVMMGQLLHHGWETTADPAAADAIVVNTCSFIESAADESIEAILRLAEFKQTGACRRLVVVGCLPERYRGDIADALPEVDVFLGTGAFGRVAEAVDGAIPPQTCLLPDPDRAQPVDGPRRRPSLRHAVYLKIAEGCSRHCTYCIIPKLRGTQKSRPADDILAEAHQLVAQGARELTLVAQETTRYGRDLSGDWGLDRLFTRLAEQFPDVWFRFLYGHPESLQPGVVEAVAGHHNICPYFDIPIQHSSSRMLKKMGRASSAEHLRDLFAAIRREIPDAALRSTVMVGFPGETESDFENLLSFIEQVGFDHLGVFTYSDADDLPAHHLPDHVPPGLAQERYHRLMRRQQVIARANNQKYIGTTLPVLIDGRTERGVWIGRSQYQAPEVDGIVYLNGRAAEPVRWQAGSIVTVKVIDTLDYDWVGEVT